MFHNGPKMTLAISTLKSIFPLHTKTQDYHLSIQTCYSKCHNVDISLKEVTMLMKGVIFAISGRDTLRPRSI
jgi:hypothetical protein